MLALWPLRRLRQLRGFLGLIAFIAFIALDGNQASHYSRATNSAPITYYVNKAVSTRAIELK